MPVDARLEGAGLRDLAALLGGADALNESESVRACAQRIGLNLGRVPRGNVVEEQWQSVIVAADDEGKLQALVDDVLSVLGDSFSAKSIREWAGRAFKPPSASVIGGFRYDILIDTRFWLAYLEGNRHIPDRLLRADWQDLNVLPLSTLTTVMDGAQSTLGLVVAVDMATKPDPIRVSSLHELCAVLLSDLVLYRKTPGTKKWLMNATMAIRRRGRVNELEQLNAVWSFIYKNFLTQGQRADCEALIAQFVDACFLGLESQNPKRLYSEIRFLLTLAQDDASLTFAIGKALEKFRDRQDNDLDPGFFTQLNLLIGEAAGTHRRAAGQVLSFRPGLVRIPPTQRWLYEFEAMRVPLTAGDATSIAPVLESSSKPNMPFLFAAPDGYPTTREFYDYLRGQLTTLLSLISRLEDDPELAWDLPNLTEWVRMSDCEHKRFPWGDKFDAPDRANLRTPGRTVRIQPVGSYPRGASPHGVLDCCGNAYELVRIAQSGDLPEHFRLVGQSYLTPANIASCRHIGRFIPKRQPDTRRNVGLRLIRYRHEHSDLRWQNPMAIRSADYKIGLRPV